jgi:plastocyanin
VFSARKAGEGEIAAAFEGLRGAARIKVLPGTPASIKVVPEALTMAAGNREVLSVEVFDAVGNPIPAPELQWELEKGLGALVEPDQFHARKTGQEIIRLTASHVTAQVPVTIHAGRVHRIEITPPEADVTAGDRVSFTAKVYDVEGNDVPVQPAWSVGGAIGTICEDGVFQAIRAGGGHVSLQMDGVMGLALVRVGVGPIARIEFTPPGGRIKAGETIRFNATPRDAMGNATSHEISWSLSPEMNGRMTTTAGAFQMLKAGESRVIAAAGGIQGMARVHVEPAMVARISLTPKSINLAAGEEVRIAVSGEDAHGNAVSL